MNYIYHCLFLFFLQSNGPIDNAASSISPELNKFLNTNLIEIGDFKISVFNIIAIFLIVIGTRLLLFLVKKFLFSNKKDVSKDKRANYYALYQFARYILWVIAFVLIMGQLGVNQNIFTIGGGALLLGIGLGLQDLLINFISGIILMVEGSLKVGDILQLDQDVVKITEIGLRTSKGINRHNVSIIIPNSEITNNKVINWSHQRDATRFEISVGVAYGSDVEKVRELIIESAKEHPAVDTKRDIQAQFMDFGESSLDFRLIFYSYESFRIERIKSDIRYTMYAKFNENEVVIPFPQVDVHMKNK